MDQQFKENLRASIAEQAEEAHYQALAKENGWVAESATYQGKQVTLNKPFRLRDDSNKAAAVYVKNPSTGNIVMVKFGDREMGQHPNDPKRKASFRARHSCDAVEKKRDLTSAAYWSCAYLWPKGMSKTKV